MTGSIWISIHLVSTCTCMSTFIHPSLQQCQWGLFVQGCTQYSLPRRQPGRVEKMKWLSLPVGRLDWCHPGGRLALNARRVGSCSPTPCCSHGSTVFVSVYQWAGQADLRAFTLFLSRFQPGLSYLTNPQHCLFLSPLPLPASIVHWSHTRRLPPSSSVGRR